MRFPAPCLAVTLFLLTSSPLFAQNAAEPVFRVRVDQVDVDVQVLTKKGRHAVQNLRPEDFQLYDDGVRQEITVFSQDEMPLSVVFLFDLTDSVHPVLQSLASGALQALQHLKPEDEVAVMVYAASAQLLQGFTTDRELAVEAIRKAGRMESDEAAFFNEALFQASDEFSHSQFSGSRRVVIWLTDNVPNIPSEEVRMRYGRSVARGGLHNEHQALRGLFKSGAVVYTLLLTSRISDDAVAEYRKPELVLQRMQHPPGDAYKYALQTGGDVMEATHKAISTRLADLIEQIRLRYTLGYRTSGPDSPARFHRIDLKLAPGIQEQRGPLLIEAKRGYYR